MSGARPYMKSALPILKKDILKSSGQDKLLKAARCSGKYRAFCWHAAEVERTKADFREISGVEKQSTVVAQ